jgi:hypothetical protein
MDTCFQISNECYTYSLNTSELDDVKTKQYVKSEQKYNIMNYTPNHKFDDDELNQSYYRSVIKDSDNNLMCFSLPQSKSYNYFKENNKLDDDNVVVSEIIEGTMINLFYNRHKEKWELSTKSAIGGDYFFYRNEYKTKELPKQLTFKQMFMEALRQSNNNIDINELGFLVDNLEKNVCYSFVLQHPNNHIVLEIDNPKLYLICGFKLENNNASYIHFTEFRNRHFLDGLLYYPNVVNKESSYEDMEYKYTMDKNELIMGIMYYNKETGLRSHNRHEQYEKMRLIRGNNPNLQYQYLCLKKMGKVNDFLQFFPKYNKLFYGFYNEYKNFLRNIHKSYHSYYIKKDKTIINKKYLYHISKIHFEIYLPSLKETKKIINKEEVYNYFEKYDPIQQLHYLNFEFCDN